MLHFSSPSVAIYSEDNSRLAARKYARVIQKLGFDVSWLVHAGRLFRLSCDCTINYSQTSVNGNCWPCFVLFFFFLTVPGLVYALVRVCFDHVGFLVFFYDSKNSCLFLLHWRIF